MLPESFRHNPEFQKELGKSFVAAGFLAVGVLTATNPLLAVGVGSALSTSIGQNLTAGIVERAFDGMFQRRNLALENPIGWALAESFRSANIEMKNLWENSYYYSNLARNKPAEARETLEVFRMLHDHIPEELKSANESSLVLSPNSLGASQTQILKDAATLISDKFRQYSYLHTHEFNNFMVKGSQNFMAYWTEYLRRTITEKGTDNAIAWRGFQLLWNQATIEAIDQLREQVSKSLAITREQQEDLLEETKAIRRHQEELANRLRRTPQDVREPAGMEAIKNIHITFNHEINYNGDFYDQGSTKNEYNIGKQIILADRDYLKGLINSEDETTEKPIVVEYSNLSRKTYKFIGREDQIDRLKEGLNSDNEREYLFCLQGVGGIGKTTIAEEIAHYYQDNIAGLPKEQRFDAIIWTSARQSEVIGDEINTIDPDDTFNTYRKILQEIARVFNRNDIADSQDTSHLRSNVLQLLRQTRTLLVIDNFETIENGEAIIDFLGKIPVPSKAIITSKKPVLRAELIPVNEMSFDDAEKLMDQEWYGTDEELLKKHKQEIFKATGGITVAMKLIVAQMARGRGIDLTMRELKQIGNHKVTDFCLKFSTGLLDEDELNLLAALAHFPKSALPENIAKVAGLYEYNESLWVDGLNKLKGLSLINFDTSRYSILELARQYILSIRDYESLEFIRINYQELEQSINSLIQGGMAKLSEDDPTSAYNIFFDALSEARKFNDPNLIFDVLSYLESAAIKSQRLYSALDHIRDMQQIANELEDTHRYVITLDHAGRLYTRLKDYPEAIVQFQESLKYKRELFDAGSIEADEIVFTLNGLGDAYTRIGRLDEAQTYLDDSLRMCDDFGDLSGKSFTLSMLGRLESIRGDDNAAYDYYNKSLAIRRELGNPRGVAYLLNKMAASLIKIGQLAEAKQLATESLQLCREGRFTVMSIYNLDKLGEIHINLGENFPAQEYLLEALRMSEDRNLPIMSLTILSRLATVANRSEEPERVQEYIRRIFIIIDTLEDNDDKLSALRGVPTFIVYKNYPDIDLRAHLATGLSLSRENNDLSSASHFLSELYRQAQEVEDYDGALIYAKEGLNLGVKNSHFLPMVLAMHQIKGNETEIKGILHQVLSMTPEQLGTRSLISIVGSYIPYLEERDIQKFIGIIEETLPKIKAKELGVFRNSISLLYWHLQQTDPSKALRLATLPLKIFPGDPKAVDFMEGVAKNSFYHADYQSVFIFMKHTLANNQSNITRGRIINFLSARAEDLENNGLIQEAILFREEVTSYLRLANTPDQLIDNNNETLKLYQQVDNPSGIVKTLVDLGNIYYEQRSFSKARENARNYFQEALKYKDFLPTYESQAIEKKLKNL